MATALQGPKRSQLGVDLAQELAEVGKPGCQPRDRLCVTSSRFSLQVGHETGPERTAHGRHAFLEALRLLPRRWQFVDYPKVKKDPLRGARS